MSNLYGWCLLLTFAYFRFFGNSDLRFSSIIFLLWKNTFRITNMVRENARNVKEKMQICKLVFSSTLVDHNMEKLRNNKLLIVLLKNEHNEITRKVSARTFFV